MGIFKDQIQFVRDFRNQILFNALRRTFNQFGFVLKDFIVNKQLFQRGIDGNNEMLPGYSRFTIRIKLSKQQPIDRVTLRDTGRFVNSITVEASGDNLEIKSNVDYDQYIVDQYTIDVLAPTKENLTEFLTNFFIPLLREQVTNILNQ